jgi:hypothetical protein
MPPNTQLAIETTLTANATTGVWFGGYVPLAAWLRT